ncbi:hypothetical protein D3C73_1173220 [compost metagenome]
MAQRIIDVFEIIRIYEEQCRFDALPPEVIVHRLEQGDAVRQIAERIHVGQAVHILLTLQQHVVLLHKLLLRRCELLICRFQLLVAVVQFEFGLLTSADIN